MRDSLENKHVSTGIVMANRRHLSWLWQGEAELAQPRFDSRQAEDTPGAHLQEMAANARCSWIAGMRASHVPLASTCAKKTTGAPSAWRTRASSTRDTVKACSQ
jgi:hypothetical protein